jgi:hypothetical protein
MQLVDDVGKTFIRKFDTIQRAGVDPLDPAHEGLARRVKELYDELSGVLGTHVTAKSRQAMA